jgi:hypothetical protein
MSETLPMRTTRALKVVWAITMPTIPYEGLERVYVLTGLRYRNTRIITGMHEVPNVSPFPVDTFTVLQRDVKVITVSLPPENVVLGYAHTHPDNFPMPSINDICGIAHGMLGLVISNETNHSWYVRNKTISPITVDSLVG